MLLFFRKNCWINKYSTSNFWLKKVIFIFGVRWPLTSHTLTKRPCCKVRVPKYFSFDALPAPEIFLIYLVFFKMCNRSDVFRSTLLRQPTQNIFCISPIFRQYVELSFEPKLFINLHTITKKNIAKFVLNWRYFVFDRKISTQNWTMSFPWNQNITDSSHWQSILRGHNGQISKNWTFIGYCNFVKFILHFFIISFLFYGTK